MKFLLRVKPVGLACIGWSYPAPGVDIPFSRRIMKSNGSLIYGIYIPGSSLKGVLRSAASRVASSYGFKSCGGVRPEFIEELHKDFGGPCDVCKLFGYPKVGIPSPLIVSDLKPAEGTLREVFSMTRIRLNDETLKAAEGALFTSEHLGSHVEFSGYVIVLTEDQELLGLLCLSIAELRLGRIGRHSIIDIKLEETEKLEKLLASSRWRPLVEDLRGWLWNEAV